MKNNSIKRSLLIMLTMLVLAGVTTSEAIAQRGQGWKKGGQAWRNAGQGMCMNMPDLSEDQMDQIQDLRTGFMKETLELRNKIQLHRAELKMLATGDNVDLNKVNNKIDQIAELRAQMMKEHASHRQNVRELLNEDQQVIFDQRGPGFGMGMERGRSYGKKQGMRQGGNRGYGAGPYCPWYDQQNEE